MSSIVSLPHCSLSANDPIGEVTNLSSVVRLIVGGVIGAAGQATSDPIKMDLTGYWFVLYPGRANLNSVQAYSK